MVKRCDGCGVLLNLSDSGIEGTYFDSDNKAVCYCCFIKRRKKPFKLPKS